MDMNFLMQQAQKLQRDMQKAQADLEAKEFEVLSAGGAIKVKITGKKQITHLEIDDDLFEDKEMLTDMLQVAINEAINKVLKEEATILNNQKGNLKLF